MCSYGCIAHHGAYPPFSDVCVLVMSESFVTQKRIFAEDVVKHFYIFKRPLNVYVCILNVMHLNAFRCIHMRCILMHSDYDAFMCITVCMHSERDAFLRIFMHANALHSNAF